MFQLFLRRFLVEKGQLYLNISFLVELYIDLVYIRLEFCLSDLSPFEPREEHEVFPVVNYRAFPPLGDQLDVDGFSLADLINLEVVDPLSKVIGDYYRVVVHGLESLARLLLLEDLQRRLSLPVGLSLLVRGNEKDFAD